MNDARKKELTKIRDGLDALRARIENVKHAEETVMDALPESEQTEEMQVSIDALGDALYSMADVAEGLEKAQQ